MTFTSIAKILDKRLQRSGIAKQVNAALVCEEFDKIMIEIWGDKIKNQAQAMYLKDKVLTVACLSPIIAQELKIKENKLLEKINKKMPGINVQALRFLT